MFRVAGRAAASVSTIFLYETKLSPPTRQTSENKEGRSAPRWRLSRERNQVSMAFTTVLSGSAAKARARLCVSMFSSASFVLLFRIQSSLSDHLHGLLCFLHRRRMKICCLWSHSLCVLISSSNLLADFVVTNVFSSSFLLDFVFSFSFV